ncbi:MAG: peptidase dimerization domain-containing protein, partial [Gammaproteobacteria bacterium]|nr:peptidase dimerization domain-containing protein [Gammaproteobacteria bacterium]
LLASLHSADGTIRVADFMADVIAPSQAELDAIKRMPDVGSMLQEKLNLGRTDLNGIRLEEAIMQPAIIIKGIDGGGAGPGKSRNIIQPSATASLNIRLVPGQTVARVMQQLSAHFEKMGYLLLDKPATPEQLKKNKRVLFLASSGGYRAYRSRMDSPEAQELSQLLKEIDGEPPLLTPTMGGSLPIYLFEEYLEMPIIIFPVANHDNNQHGRNENLRLQNLWDAIAAYAVVISEYSK